jgi:hypothetical protein
MELPSDSSTSHLISMARILLGPLKLCVLDPRGAKKAKHQHGIKNMKHNSYLAALQ